MISIEKEFKKVMELYPIGEKLIFDKFNFDEFDLNLAFHMKNGEYQIIKHGLLSVGTLKWLNLYFNKDTYLQICFEDDTILGYSMFRTFNKYFLKSSFDRSFWLGSKDDRGLMFYDDYFYCKEIHNFFYEFVENFCSKYFLEFDDFSAIDYKIEDAFFKVNLLELLKNINISKEELDKALAEEIDSRDWIIDYSYDEESLEIYYLFNDSDLEKRFDFIRNNTYILKIIEENRVYDRKINTSFFQRDVNSEFCQKEYVGINYDNDLSIIEVNVGVPIDVDDFKRGE